MEKRDLYFNKPSESSKTDMQFQKLKQSKLSGVDLSRKGGIDEPIRPLIEKLNSCQDYFSLSSCSGRVMIASKERNNEKQGLPWHSNLHHCPSVDELKSNLKGQNTILKYEPFILHVQCRDIGSAKLLLNEALQSGFRNSGLVPSKQGRCVLAVRSTLTLELPVTNAQGNVLISDAYVEVIQEIIQSKFEQNKTYVGRFEKSLEKFCINENEEN